jgi:hypothetical protein
MPSFRQDGKVTLWICLDRHTSDSDGDPLKDLFGIEHYDLDELEPVGDWTLQPLEALFDDLSYSASFKNRAMEIARAAGISKARFIIALFNFAYDPNLLSLNLPAEPKFLGVFDWHDNS